MHPAFTLARRLVALAGPGRYLLLGEFDDLLAAELRLLGCTVAARSQPDPVGADSLRYDVALIGSALILTGAPNDGLPVRRDGVSRYLFILDTGDGAVTRLDPMRAALLANRVLSCGFRRALAEWSSDLYLRFEASPDFLMFEPIQAVGLGEPAETGPERLQSVAGARAGRGLSVDMSREFGSHADAHLLRYALAAERVRPGDVVLDCVCGRGYGSALIAARSLAARVVGIDSDAHGIAYASEHFSGRYGVEYQRTDDADLGAVDDHSVDLIVFFEAIERIDEVPRMMAAFARILKPDGRIIASVPGLRTGEGTGRNQDACHGGSLGHEQLGHALAKYFVIESRYAVAELGVCGLQHARRRLTRVPLGATPERDAGWWVIVASARPDLPQRRPYRHPEFAAQAEGGVGTVDFGAHYDNPWIYRSIVQMGQRIEDAAVLTDASLAVLGSSRIDSPDFGAAACVLAYQVLARRDRGQIDSIGEIVEAYLAIDAANPHIRRWQISLSYALALLYLMDERQPEALACFEHVLQQAPIEFSSLLATKSIAACYWIGILRLTQGEDMLARQAFERGVAQGRDALRAVDRASIGMIDNPLPFAFQELAEVADMSSQCAKALHCMPLHSRAPGLFWRQVDTRRFGLATWSLQLQQENQQLREALGRLTGL